MDGATQEEVSMDPWTRRNSSVEDSNGDSAKTHQLSNGPDEACGFRCGFGRCILPCKCLQPLATVKWALAIICLANFTQQTATIGHYGVSVSTLEKRFELRSTESGLIGSVLDLMKGSFMIVIMFMSRDIDKPRFIGWCLVVTGLAMALTALPHFTAPEYKFIDEDVNNYCGNVTEPDCEVTPMRNYLYWFMICFAIMGAGTCPLYVSGMTYLDENVDKANSALYNSIFLAIGGLGPPAGFFFGGMSLELYTYPSMNSEIEIDSTSPFWIGAWWLPFLIVGILVIMISCPLLMLPKYLPGSAKYRKNRDVESQKSHLESSTRDGGSGCSKTAKDIWLLLKNKPYVFITMGQTFNMALVYGFVSFGVKYIESVFGVTPFHSSLLFGITAVFSSFGAQVCSGLIMKKMKLQVRGIVKFCVLGGLASAICSFGFLIHCEDIDFAGGNRPYLNESIEEISLNQVCNDVCDCSTGRYEPVCADGVEYFSPCFAGCSLKINETAYTDCSCILSTNSSNKTIVSSERCDSNACSQIIPFVLAGFLCFFTSILTLAPTVQITMRCVPFNKRDIAMSFQSAVVRLLGIIPGRTIVGVVLDLACVSWSTECGERGSCKLYNRWELAKNNTLLLLAQTTICAVFYILVMVTYDPVGEANVGTAGRLNEEASQDEAKPIFRTEESPL